MKRFGRVIALVALAGAVGLWGCGGEPGEEDIEDGGGSTADAGCQSGQRWTGGEAESPLMLPGQDCIGCHMQRGEGPQFLIAGTVYPDFKDADGCYGSAGVEVEITDDTGQVYRLTTNAAGNFMLTPFEAPGFTPPFTARVLAGGKERAMASPQMSGSCNTCHTRDGQNGAPGRITVP